MVAGTSPSRWGLILVGGDGTRLRSLTRRIAGDERPKRFCRLLGSETLLEQTRRRAARLLSPERILTVVVRQHQRFYGSTLADTPSGRTVGLRFWGSSFVGGPGRDPRRGAGGRARGARGALALARSEQIQRVWPFFCDRRVDAYEGLIRRYRD